jgi:fibronectin-binding autotransporter adhesin
MRDRVSGLLTNLNKLWGLGMRGFPRVLVAGAVALGLGVVGVGSAHAAPTCTDSWTNASGGSWDTGTNWSTGSAPTSTDSVCITAAGTYTVLVGNETISVANLTVGAAGSTPTLQIGNGGSNEPHITVTGTAATVAGGTISDGWGGSFGAGTLTNAGTFLVPSTGYNSSYTFGNVTNSGSFTVNGGAAVSLSNGDTFDNAGGTISVGGTSTALALTSPTAGDGTLELDSGGTINIGSGDNFTVADVTAVHGGTICGTALTIGSQDGGTGGTLAFATTPGTGPPCGTGVATDQVFITNTSSTLSGTIPTGYTVIAGDGGSSFNNTTLSGNVVNDGTFEPGFGATVIGSGTTNELTNKGTVQVPASGYNTNLNTTLVNTGTVNVGANIYASLATGQSWSNGTKGTDGTISVAATRVLELSSPSEESATFTQDGTITNSGTFNVADPIQINGGTICGNPLNLGGGDGQPGTLTLAFATKLAKGAACAKKVVKGHVFIYNVTATINSNIPKGYTVAIGDGGSSYAHVSTPGSLTNAGALQPGFGATLTVNGTLTNSGTLTVPVNGYNTVVIATPLVNSGTITANGNLTVTGSITDNKALVIKASKTETLPEVSVSGTYTQGAKGTLTDALSTTGHGLLNVGGTASLAGNVKLTGKPALKKGAQVEFLESGGDSGTFAKVTGPFTLTYNAANVTATAT